MRENKFPQQNRVVLCVSVSCQIYVDSMNYKFHEANFIQLTFELLFEPFILPCMLISYREIWMLSINTKTIHDRRLVATTSFSLPVREE